MKFVEVDWFRGDEQSAEDRNTIRRLRDLIAEKDAEIRRLRGALAWAGCEMTHDKTDITCPRCGLRGGDLKDNFQPVVFKHLGDTLAVQCRVCHRIFMHRIE